jgi:hypothetical protein
MSRSTGPTLHVLLLWAAAGLVGCAGDRHVESPLSEGTSSADQIAQARAVLGELGESRFAKGAPIELARAEQWLVEAEGRIADGDAEDELTVLTVLAARAQLGAIKAFYARREAETALEDVRSGYEQQKNSLDALAGENQRLLESTGDVP